MTEEQLARLTKDLVKANEVSTKTVVYETVNGKIDAMRQEHQNDMITVKEHIVRDDERWEKIQPIIEGIQGTRIVGKVFLWMASIGVAYMAVKNFRI